MVLRARGRGGGSRCCSFWSVCDGGLALEAEVDGMRLVGRLKWLEV